MTAVTEHVVQDGTFTIRPLQPTIGAEISGAVRNYGDFPACSSGS